MSRIMRHAAFCALMLATPAFATDYSGVNYAKPANASLLEEGNGVTLASGVTTARAIGETFVFQVIFDTGDLPEPPWWDWQNWCGITTPPTYPLPLPPANIKLAIYSEEHGYLWDCDRNPLIVPVFVDVDCPQYGPFLYWTAITITMSRPLDHHHFEVCPVPGAENMPIKYLLFRQ